MSKPSGMRKHGHLSGLDIPLVVIERRPESVDCYSIIFELPRHFTYLSGHWMDLRFVGNDAAGIKTFSFASSPTEPAIVITYKAGVSQFKQALDAVQPGEELRIVQYGGHFQFDERRAALMVAGGVGIAPFRGMIKEVVDRQVPVKIDVVYLNTHDDFPFRSELERWQDQRPGLATHFVNTRQAGRLDEKQLLALVPDVVAREAYIAGPPGMVAQVDTLLHTLGLQEHQMHSDVFDGY